MTKNELAEQAEKLLAEQAKLLSAPPYTDVLAISYRSGWREGILSLRDKLRVLILEEEPEIETAGGGIR